VSPRTQAKAHRETAAKRAHFGLGNREHLTTAVRLGLQAELSGDESTKEICELVREIIEDKLN
jgi:hypothetical protein